MASAPAMATRSCSPPESASIRSRRHHRGRQRQARFDSAVDFCPVEPKILRAEGHVSRHGRSDELVAWVLEHHPDTCPGDDGVVRHVRPVDVCRSGVGGRQALTCRTSVVLPLPFGPTSRQYWPSGIDSVTPSRTSTSPYRCAVADLDHRPARYPPCTMAIAIPSSGGQADVRSHDSRGATSGSPVTTASHGMPIAYTTAIAAANATTCTGTERSATGFGARLRCAIAPATTAPTRKPTRKPPVPCPAMT